MNVSFLKNSKVNAIKTTRVITSCITFSSTNEKGPPDSLKPMRLAGTWKKYSNKAIPQLMRITEISGNELNHLNSLNFKWPYHANVINVFDKISKTIV